MADEKIDLYNHSQRIDEKIRRIRDDKNILPRNKTKLLEYIEHMQAGKNKKATISKDVYALHYLSIHIKKDFMKCKEADIDRLCAKINTQKSGSGKAWSLETKRNHKVNLKKFYKWLYGVKKKGVYPPIVENVETTLGESDRKLPSDLLTDEEIEMMVRAADNPRDKALLLSMYETGARIGEMLNVRIKHIVFNDFGAYIMLNGKTGMRRVAVIMSSPALATFIDMHPKKDDPDSLLFLTKMNRNKIKGYEPLSYAGARKVLRVLAERAGIKKHIHPHLLRHTSATRAAKFLTEAQMKEYYGWTRGSDMPSVYVHLSGRDTEEAIKRMHGIANEGEKTTKATIKICQRCKIKNSFGSKFCNSCGYPLDLQTAMDVNNIYQQILRFAPQLAEMSKMSDKELAELKKKNKGVA